MVWLVWKGGLLAQVEAGKAVGVTEGETDAVVGRPRVGLSELSGDRKRCNLQNKAHDRQGNEGIRIAIAHDVLGKHVRVYRTPHDLDALPRVAALRHL